MWRAGVPPPKKRLPWKGSLWEQRRGASKALLDLGIALGQDLVGGGAEGAAEEAAAIRDCVLPEMTELRAVCDEAETVTARDCWPFPTYSELLRSEG